MKKILKYIGIVLVVFFVCLVLVVIALITFVSSNRFKPFIIETVKTYTGRELSLEGDLSWTFFPSAGIKVKNVRLTNSPAFKNPVFANIKEMTVLINLRPLLDKKIESTGVVIEGMQLNLIENAQGKNNWEISFPQYASEKNAKKVASTTATTSSPFPYMIVIAGAQIKDSSISYTNEITKKTLQLNQVNLKATHFSLNQPFKFNAAFDYQINESTNRGHVELQTDVAIHLSEKLVTLKNIALHVNIPDLPTTLMGNMTIDLQDDRLQADNLQFNMDGIKANLTVRMIGLSDQLRLSVQAQIMPFNLAQWLSKHHYMIGNIAGLTKVDGVLTLTQGPQPLSVTGAVNADMLAFNDMKIQAITAKLSFKNNILHLSPFSANFYQGKIAGNADINFNTTMPQIAFNTTIRHIDIGALPNNAARLKFAGRGDVDLSVKTFGLIPGDFKRNARGHGRMVIREGVLQGVDVDYLLESAIAFVKGQPPAVSNTGQTPFTHTTASFTIDKGILSNQDFLLLANKFQMKGQGAMDLVDEEINYQLQVFLNKADANSQDGLLNLYGLPIPIKMTGSLQNPKTNLDKDVLIKSFATQQFKKVKNDLQDKIKDKKTKDILNKLFGS